jgi:hypothetical protein
VADLTVPMMNQVLEATLAFMILLLGLSVTAIVRLGPMPQAQNESNAEGDMAIAGTGAFPNGLASMFDGQAGMASGPPGMFDGQANLAVRPASLTTGPASTTAGPQAGRPAQPTPFLATWANPATGGFQSGAAEPPPRRSGFLGRGRYEAKHVRGRRPAPRPAAPAGPPWGPAVPPPPGRPQQGAARQS